MRVIAGKARRIQLKTISGNDTRPTTDRIKETLFNILQPDLYDSTFLDLFSGSGAIGIEALSRGAAEAVFVDLADLSDQVVDEVHGLVQRGLLAGAAGVVERLHAAQV